MAVERDFIAELSRALRLPPRRREAIARELQSHLEDSRRELTLAGWRPEDAARESRRRLGDPGEVAGQFVGVYRSTRRRNAGLALGLAGALLLGAYGANGSLASATAAHHPAPLRAGHLSPQRPHQAHHATRLNR